MKWGKDSITIYTLTTTTDASEDVTETWDDGVTVSASVVQIDGARYVKEEELIDKAVYRVECFDNSYSNNIKIVFGSLTLFPIRPWTKNADRSMRSIAKIIMATKV
ncbi:MAG TPA: head-tail adaptor protein [Bacteroidales bacterium]|nr:head-tail adaptor protein [Bacteroidales bacterium]